jgi:hypothetical protein
VKEWDVDGMMEAMSSTQFDEWVEYLNLEPQGAIRSDLQAAIVAHAAAQPHYKKRLKPKDFVLKFDALAPPKGPQTEEEMKARLVGITAKMGGTLPDPPDVSPAE